jgi:membrane protein YqaA with SNARE-associated domain
MVFVMSDSLSFVKDYFSDSFSFDKEGAFGYLEEMDFLPHGYFFLFFLSFLASTLLPIGSELMLVGMVSAGYEPSFVIATATAGNALGACLTYWIGLIGSTFLVRRVMRFSEVSSKRGEAIFRRYGIWSLLFSWVPVVGDPICLVAGTFRVPFMRFAALVALGKGLRYAAVAWITLRALPI